MLMPMTHDHIKFEQQQRLDKAANQRLAKSATGGVVQARQAEGMASIRSWRDRLVTATHRRRWQLGHGAWH